MSIRKAKEADAEVIAQNNILLARESEGVDITFEVTLAGVQSVLADPGKGFYLVAEANDKVIGQMMITFEWSDWRNRNIWWLQSVYVLEPWRGRGIFKQLVEAVKEHASAQNVKILKLYVYNKNRNAIDAYTHIGMEKTPYMVFQQSV